MCREILLEGSVTVTTDLFTVTGSTKAWLASPVPIRSSGAVASGTVAAGTVATAAPVSSSAAAVTSAAAIVSSAAAGGPGGFGFPTK